MFNDVLYTVNKKYLLVFLASLTSLLRNSNLDNIRIHLVTDGFDKDDFDKVYEVIAKFPGTKINCYNIDWFDIERFDIPDWRGTQIANARLFLSSVNIFCLVLLILFTYIKISFPSILYSSKQLSAYSRIIFTDLSVDPPSTMMCSKSRKVCAATESSVLRKPLALLYVIVIIESFIFHKT